MIKEILSRLRTFRWQKLLIIWAVFVAMAAVLFAERSGIQYKAAKFRLDYLPRTEVEPAQTAMFGQPVTCLLLYDSGQEGTDLAKEQFAQILLDMKVSTRAVDVHTTSLEGIPEFDRYKTVVVLMSDLDALGNRLIDLMNWVQDGGSVLFAMTPQKTTYFDAISPKLGVLSASWEYKTAESIVPAEEFMLGGGQRYEFSDPFQSSLSVSLREEATVYARTGDEGVPLVWGTKSGAGRVVVDNIGIYDKIMRGIYAASFSLLCDAAAYPVINSSVFYLDDFPSPVPGGDGSYIRRDYGMSIADFYSKVWWPDLVKLAQQYSIRFTGVMIENYEDDTQSTPVRQSDTQQFRYYGSLLLQQGGEVGFHGYNHQPLVLPDTDYKDLYSYRQWPSEDAIVAAMNELIDFQKTVLPNTEGSVYVPPSNILSAAGRKVLGSKVSQIRTIASTYFEDGTSLPYVQEFGVASDGIVEQPRIVSGGMVGDTYMRLAAMSELNMLRKELPRTLHLLEASHMSFIGPKTAPVKYAKGYNAVLKQLGYRLRVTELKLTPCADGVCAELTVANEGAAPFYWEWPVNLYVEDVAGNTLYTACLPLSLPELMPGDSQKASVRLEGADAEELLSGGWKRRSPKHLTIGIVDPMTGRDAVRFAMKAEQKSGRTTLL